MRCRAGKRGWPALASYVRPFTRQVTETPTKLVNLWPASRIDELMPLAYPKAAPSAGNV
jgi:hypothetical protein